MNSRMVPREALKLYYGKIADILCHWPNNQMPKPFVSSILINGLYSPELKMFVKEATSLACVKVWEECHYEQFLPIKTTMIPIQGNTFVMNSNGMSSGYPKLPTSHTNVVPNS